MKKSTFVFTGLLLAAIIAMSVTARAEENQILVSATGTVTVRPDMAEFGVVLRSVEKDAGKAAARTAEKYRAVQQALRSAGIPPEDATTSSFTVSPEWEWDAAAGRNHLKGYAARHLITVRVRSLTETGRAIDAVTGAGADEVHPLVFSSSRFDLQRRQALAAAVEQARTDAEVMAKAAGGRLGQAIELSVGQPVYRGGPVMETMAMKAAAAPAPTEIAPSDQDISVTVNTRWKLLGASSR